jgi:hypothetical protein
LSHEEYKLISSGVIPPHLMARSNKRVSSITFPPLQDPLLTLSLFLSTAESHKEETSLQQFALIFILRRTELISLGIFRVERRERHADTWFELPS